MPSEICDANDRLGGIHVKKTIAVLLAAVTFTLTGCGAEQSSEESSKEKSYAEAEILVTLGDSISAGYGLENPETERYSALLTERLVKKDKNEWRDCNYAVSGDDSSDLLQRLDDGRAIRLPAADVIAICIGANNLLGPFGEYMQTVMDTKASSQDKKDAVKKLEQGMDDGLKTLEADLDSMYDWIRKRNTTDEAKLYLMNIYNPYADCKKEKVPNMDDNMADYAQKQVDRCNTVIEKFANAHSDIVLVDIAQAFAECKTVPIQGKKEDDDMVIADPHPDTKGHQIIADTLYDAIEANEK